jgi:hypothetical protein
MVSGISEELVDSTNTTQKTTIKICRENKKFFISQLFAYLIVYTRGIFL